MQVINRIAQNSINVIVSTSSSDHGICIILVLDKIGIVHDTVSEHFDIILRTEIRYGLLGCSFGPIFIRSKQVLCRLKSISTRTEEIWIGGLNITQFCEILAIVTIETIASCQPITTINGYLVFIDQTCGSGGFFYKGYNFVELYNPSADVLLFVRASNAEIYAMRLSYVAL